MRLIAVVERNFGLSSDGKIPWEFKEDRELFHKLTLNSVVVMGRHTFFSHKNIPLKDRINCVITHEKIPNIECFASLELSLEKYHDCWIIGGAEVYNYALENNLISEAIITQVKKSYPADRSLNHHLLNNFYKETIILKKDYRVLKYTLKSSL